MQEAALDRESAFEFSDLGMNRNEIEVEEIPLQCLDQGGSDCNGFRHEGRAHIRFRQTAGVDLCSVNGGEDPAGSGYPCFWM
ncbi:unnamed protein product [Microthlaspi erraticum]|uniref:Uncharacterized protein n=1 Tax=Microthlaspi erraticum TaxID=1685480 RepID=A0A6D2K207_9BRAS|nr:unnamed protein product [Microthlaspi erraticum]CAA7046638.1 unnamed protein product [Microthlaspi erraticum]